MPATSVMKPRRYVDRPTNSCFIKDTYPGQLSSVMIMLRQTDRHTDLGTEKLPESQINSFETTIAYMPLIQFESLSIILVITSRGVISGVTFIPIVLGSSASAFSQNSMKTFM